MIRALLTFALAALAACLELFGLASAAVAQQPEPISPSNHTSNFANLILAAALAAAPGAAQAQSEAKVYRIGILTELRVEDLQRRWQDALRERGYIEGKNAIFEVRAAGEKFDLLPKLATELVQEKVDIILTSSTPPAVAAKQVTSTIPIVTLSADPIGAGLVRSLAHPGGNVTGVYVPVVDMAAKRLQLLKEAVPGLTSIAILWNPRNSTAQLQAKATEAVAQSLRLTTFSVEVANQSDLDGALQLLHAKRPTGFIVMQDPVMFTAAKKLAEFAIKNQLPAFHPYRVFADAGGLMSYGVSLKGLLELGAIYADKVLKGAKPADLPMEQPSRYEFVVNLKTARALGITIPESILLRADEVIR
jgi:putative ABC transport system substrate-binding protein